MSSGIRFERIFADLCSRHFLRGFVFHSPRFFDPLENEAGDIVLWVRNQVVVFEAIARDATGGLNTKQFVKRIGEKRDQLHKDYRAFRDMNIKIHMINEQNEAVFFDKHDLEGFSFSGVVIVDCNCPIEKLHFGTIEKSLSLPFPVAIMSRQNFIDLTSEVDTIPDLTYYLFDRFEFLKQIYGSNPQYFLDLNSNFERNLIAFYKTYENKFLLDNWKQENALNYYSIYASSLQDNIIARDAENDESFIIDKIIDFLRLNNKSTDSTLLHSWELAIMTRRQRAGWLSNKISDAIERMLSGKPKRHFAFFNQTTGCWLVFYFRHGGNKDEFKEDIEKLTKYKLFVEMKKRNFEYSVFGYGFRKSVIETGAIFDEIILLIEDADEYSSVPEREYNIACQYFGKTQPYHIREFPI